MRLTDQSSRPDAFDVVIGCWRTVNRVSLLGLRHPSTVFINLGDRSISRNGHILAFYEVPFRIFTSFIVTRGSITSRYDVIDYVWGDSSDGGPDNATAILSLVLARYRTYLCDLDLYLENEWGRGWRIVDQANRRSVA